MGLCVGNDEIRIQTGMVNLMKLIKGLVRVGWKIILYSSRLEGKTAVDISVLFENRKFIG
jgi:hypothetical protein